jgi:hypothetical protein
LLPNRQDHANLSEGRCSLHRSPQKNVLFRRFPVIAISEILPLIAHPKFPRLSPEFASCPLEREAWPRNSVKPFTNCRSSRPTSSRNIASAFNQAFRYLKNRIAVFIALPVRSLDTLSLANRLKEIGRMEGASQVYFNAGLAYWLNRLLGVEWCVAGPSALIGASNFFELAVATAIALFGFQSGAALSTVVGVLVEVPVMLSVVHLVRRSRGWYERGAQLRASNC